MPRPRRRHRPAAERRRLEALEAISRAAFAFRAQLAQATSPLPCQTPREWGIYSAGSRRPVLELMHRACRDCTAAFQADAQRRDVCRPPQGAATPAVRLQARLYGRDDPIRHRTPRRR